MKTSLLRMILIVAIGALVVYGVGSQLSRLNQGIAAAKESDSLDPGRFRAQLQRVEALLFSAGPLPPERRRALSGELRALADSLEQRGGSSLATYYSGELRTLAGWVRGFFPAPLGGNDLASARANWKRIRSSLFDDAAWYRWTEADSANVVEPPRRTMTPEQWSMLEVIESVLDRTEPLIPRGRADAERLGEPQVDPEWVRDNYPAMIEAWAAWSRDWRAEIEEIQDRLPARPGFEMPPEVRFAFDDAAGALNALHMVSGVGGGGWSTPFKREWEERFREAEIRAAEARKWTRGARDAYGPRQDP